LLLASATTGKTILQSIESINYYGGKVEGICAIFSAISQIADFKVNTLFTQKDIPNYESYHSLECPHCKEQRKIDAIVNSYGYSRF